MKEIDILDGGCQCFKRSKKSFRIILKGYQMKKIIQTTLLAFTILNATPNMKAINFEKLTAVTRDTPALMIAIGTSLATSLVLTKSFARYYNLAKLYNAPSISTLYKDAQQAKAEYTAAETAYFLLHPGEGRHIVYPETVNKQNQQRSGLQQAACETLLLTGQASAYAQQGASLIYNAMRAQNPFEKDEQLFHGFNYDYYETHGTFLDRINNPYQAGHEASFKFRSMQRQTQYNIIAITGAVAIALVGGTCAYFATKKYLLDKIEHYKKATELIKAAANNPATKQNFTSPIKFRRNPV